MRILPPNLSSLLFLLPLLCPISENSLLQAEEVATYALSVSTRSNRGEAIALNGATFSGNVYVFTSYASQISDYDPAGITKVSYWLDNTAMSGWPTHTEHYMPYDFAGSVNDYPSSLANPWDTTKIANGTHAITQLVYESNGDTEVDTATFTVNNNVASYAQLTANPTSVNFGAVPVGSTRTQSVALKNTGTSSLTVMQAAVSGSGFSTSGLNLPLSLAPGQSASVNVNFAPQVAGSTTGAVSLLCSGSTSSTSVTLAGSGTVVATYALSVSTQSDRSGAIALDGATLSGSVYAFTSLASQLTNYAPIGITQVSYWLDNPAMSGSPTHTEHYMPYDFAGSVNNSSSSLAKPWDTTQVGNGTHTITQLVYESNGTTEVDAATFTINNSTVTVLQGHYEYVFPDQNMYVYAMDNNFQLVKHVSFSQAKGIRGVGAVPSTHMLYIAYGGDGGTYGTGSLLKYDLLTDTVVWTQSYPFGVDSFAITPSGTTLYMPDGENSGDGTWYVIDASTGTVTGSINTNMNGPHNTVVSLDGQYVFMGPRHSSSLVDAYVPANGAPFDIGPVNQDVRPFTINGTHTLAFTTATGMLGFQVSDIATGGLLYTVSVPGFSVPSGFWLDTPCHGISLSPDEKEIYLIDTANAYAHVFDVSGLPSTAPALLASIPLTTTFTGSESPCTYDCAREGWIRHSRSGQFVLVGDSGNVINTSTRQVTTTLPALYNSRKFLEIDWQNGSTVSTTTRSGLGYVTAASGQLAASPTSLDFGTVLVGSTSSQSVALSNTGTASLTVSQATVTGSGFSLSGPTIPLSLAPGQTTSFNVNFAPQIAASVTASVSLSSDASNSLVTISLTGSGAIAGGAAQITTHPTSLNFGTVRVGSTSAQPVAASNTGTASATISQANLTGSGFTLSGLTLPLTLSPGQTKTFNVNFDPLVGGSATGSVSLVSDAPNSPTNVLLAGSATHFVTLDWTPSTSAVAGYNIYRASQSGGPYTRINSSLLTVNTYTDSGVLAGQTYYYVSTAVSSNGMESTYSNETQAVVPSP